MLAPRRQRAARAAHPQFPLVWLAVWVHNARVHTTGSDGNVRSSDDVIDRRAVAHDLWPRRLLERREELPVELPARVWWPADDAEVQRVVRAARVDRVPIVPFGAGSGVCGGISPTTKSWIVDMKRMARLVAVDVERGTCTVEAGMLGERLEEQLNARGLTLGHFPSSIYCSTVGGWVATRSAGQLSSHYGKIEDMVVAVEGVDGRGERVRAAIDDPATGPGLVQLLVGSEGALCIVTRATLRVHPLSSHRWLRAARFDSIADGVEALRAIMQSGEQPAVLRLYDGVDAALSSSPASAGEPDRIEAGGIARANLEHSGPGDAHGAGASAGEDDEEPTLFDQLSTRIDELALFSRPRAARRIIGEILGRPQLANAVIDRLPQRPKLIVGLEGTPAELDVRIAPIRSLLEKHRAHDLGGEAGRKWLRHRHRVSYRMSRAFAAGSWVDTFEVCTAWDGVVPLYKEMREALSELCVVMCHFSHAYVDGCSLYFTLAGGGSPGAGARSSLSRYDHAWERALAVAKKHGAPPAHHHGMGRSKLAGQKLAPAGRALLASLKRALDPDGILNPGVLGLV